MNLKSCIEKIEKLSRDYRHSDMDNVEYISELYPLLVRLSEFSEIEAQLAAKDRQLEAALAEVQQAYGCYENAAHILGGNKEVADNEA